MKVSGSTGTISRARTLRAELSLPEVMLWQRLRGSPGGVRFRRQHPAGPYILDFFCSKATLVIEIDGICHSMGNAAQHDARRQLYLAGMGLHVWRIAAAGVLNNVDEVATAIITLAHSRLPLHHAVKNGAVPLPEVGEDFPSEAVWNT